MNILIVSPAFPPYSGVGALRMKSLSSYLCEQGEEVTVIRNVPSFWGDDSKTQVPKGMEIIDVSVDNEMSFEQCAQVYEKTIEAVLLNKKFDLIIYSVGPYYTLTTAINIKEKFGIRYILDFRDLWVHEKMGKISFVVKLKRFIKRYPYRSIEKKAVQGASSITVVTPGDRRIMRKKYKLDKEMVNVIYNGHEVDDSKHEKDNSNNEFVIANLGKFAYYSYELAEKVLVGIGELRSKGIHVRIIHVGKNEPQIMDIINKYNLNKDIYKCTGYLSYEDGIIIAKKADATLTLYRHLFGLGTKIFDYIACNKPTILMCTGKERLAEFVGSFKNSFICTNKNDIVNSINYIYDNNIDYLDENEKLTGFSRKEQNENFYKIMKSIKRIKD